MVAAMMVQEAVMHAKMAFQFAALHIEPLRRGLVIAEFVLPVFFGSD